jgi:two-component system, OmpR family, sensor histidine kinase TctE
VSRGQASLKWRLIRQLLIYHLLALLVAFLVALILLVRVDSGGQLADESFAVVAADAVVRRQDGGLAVRMTPALAEAKSQTPSTWFLAEDARGHSVSFGEVPSEFDSLRGRLHGVAHGDLRGREPEQGLSVVIRRETGPAGDLTVLGHGKLTAMTVALVIAANVLMFPIFALLAVVTIVLTTLIVRRSLAGVARIASEADRIDVNQRGLRLTETQVPKEIAPLVSAVNQALARLDQGYERQRRFIASAAHELRTPIAILRAKIDVADDQTARALSADVARLATLAEQLLDLHRMEHAERKDRLDPAALARRVVANLAPLLIAADKSAEVMVSRSGTVLGDEGAIERVVSNLVQNAAEHGASNIIVRVCGTSIEVEDDGPGIPAEDRERVFEPFQRLRPRSTGAGLGLNLVQQVVERHGGQITILDGTAGGALVRIDLPEA